MKISCIQDVAACRQLWEALSPRRTIYDEWDFRYCFYKYFNHPLHFHAASVDDRVIGLLPLQFNADAGHLEFFGGSYMDMNAVFMEQQFHEYIPAMYRSLTLPAELVVTQDDPFTSALPCVDFNYFFDIRGSASHEDLFAKLFSKNTQKRFRWQNRRIEKAGVTTAKDRPGALDTLIDLNLRQFGESSSFHFAHRREIFRDLLGLPFRFVMMSFLADGAVQAVTLSLVYKNTYHFLASGVSSDIVNLGSYVIAKNMDEAISLNCDIFDVGPGDCGWKERWHADKGLPQQLFSSAGRTSPGTGPSACHEHP